MNAFFPEVLGKEEVVFPSSFAASAIIRTMALNDQPPLLSLDGLKSLPPLCMV